MDNVLQHLRRVLLRRDGAGRTDGELLEAFVSRRDEASFEALVRRHGPMVLGVCRRALRNPHDAEDAFQATFLVLVRRAASVVPRERVGNWLYGVAYRTALEAKRAAARRQARERQVNEMPHPTTEPEECWRELRPLLDRELNRLPDKYRAPVVLCDLEGRTRKEAARQLGLPEGTVSGQLTTARRMLAKRLSRQGLTLSAGALATVLSRGPASAAVPAPLITSTVQSAASTATAPAAVAGVSANVTALTDGVAKALSLTRLRTVTPLLLVATLLGGAGWVSHCLQGAERQPEAVWDDDSRMPPRVIVDVSDLEKLQGTWVGVSSEGNGIKDFDQFVHENKLVFAADRMTLRTKKGGWEGLSRLGPATRPKEIDVDFGDGRGIKAIYELEGDRLKLCYSKGGERPTSFDTSEGVLPIFLFVYEKQP
jgi:RNA polymerase sigma factor (sigma-70 family)